MKNYDLNKVEYWGKSTDNDIKLSAMDWANIVDTLKDDHFSAEGLMRFKNLYLCIKSSYCVIGLLSLIPGYAFTKLSYPMFNRSHSGYKITGPLFTFYYLISIYKMSRIQISRRIHTDIFANESIDGEYVRSELSKKQPFLWANISHQLYEKGYDFPEMNEVIGYEFPSALLN